MEVPPKRFDESGSEAITTGQMVFLAVQSQN